MYILDTNKFKTYSDEETKQIEEFCKENGIQKCGREYSFILNDKRYILSQGKARVSTAVAQHMPIKAKIKMPIVRIKATKGEVIPIYNGLKEGKTVKEIRQSIEESKAKKVNTVKSNNANSDSKRKYLNNLLKGR